MIKRITTSKPLLYCEQLTDVDASKHSSRLNWVCRGRWMENDERIAFTQIQLEKTAGWIAGPFDRLAAGDTYPMSHKVVAKAFLDLEVQDVIVSMIPGENPLYSPSAFRLHEVSERALNEALHKIELGPFAITALNKSPFHPVAMLLDIEDFDDYGICVGPEPFVRAILGDLEAALERFPYEVVHDGDTLPTNTGLGSAFARRIISSINAYNCAEPGYSVLFPE